MNKLAIISSHPIQYYAPWFRHLANQTQLSVRVFYLWNFGITQQIDPGFQTSIQWDIPLLQGYQYEFVPNVSSCPGTRSFWGLQNPDLLKRVKAYKPDAVLMMAYNYASLYRFLWEWPVNQIPVLFRGDSHRLILRTGLKEIIKRQVIRSIYRRFSAFLYVGKANYHYFREHGVKDQQLFFSPHAVDNDRFINSTASAKSQARAWKRELNIPEDHAVILFSGKFEPKKRPFDLCNAFIRSQLKKTALLFVGTGPLEEELKHYCDHYSNIYFAPFQNQSLMPRTYAIADLFVLPSYGPGETWD
jgi:glycosyltransferase involved in cell wall biosynthesis